MWGGRGKWRREQRGGWEDRRSRMTRMLMLYRWIFEAHRVRTGNRLRLRSWGYEEGCQQHFYQHDIYKNFFQFLQSQDKLTEDKAKLARGRVLTQMSLSANSTWIGTIILLAGLLRLNLDSNCYPTKAERTTKCSRLRLRLVFVSMDTTLNPGYPHNGTPGWLDRSTWVNGA